MSWRLTDDDLSNGVEAATAYAERIPAGPTAAMVARGYVWLDDAARGRDWFAKAAALERSLEDEGWDWMVMVGGLLQMAGDVIAGASWLERGARMARKRRVDLETRANVAYLLGDWHEVITLTRGDKASLVASVAAARLGEPVDLAARRASISDGLRDWRLGPYKTSHATPWTDWEWLEECFCVEAELSGTQVPSHREMLLASGLMVADTQQHEIAEERDWTGGLRRAWLSPSDGLRDFVVWVAREGLRRWTDGDPRVLAATVEEDPSAVVGSAQPPPPAVIYHAFDDEQQARAYLAPIDATHAALARVVGSDLVVDAHDYDDEVAARFRSPLPQPGASDGPIDEDLDFDHDPVPRLTEPQTPS